MQLQQKGISVSHIRPKAQNRFQQSPTITSTQIIYNQITFDRNLIFSQQALQQLLNTNQQIFNDDQQLNLLTIDKTAFRLVKQSQIEYIIRPMDFYRGIEAKIMIPIRLREMGIRDLYGKQFVIQEFQKQCYKNGILVFMAQISFPCLKMLNLASLKLHSLEALSFMDAPHLQVLHLQNNKFTSSKSLTKCHFPELTGLSYYQNHFMDLKSLNRGKYTKLIDYNDSELLELKNKNPRSIYNLRQNVRQKQREMSLILQLLELEDQRGSRNNESLGKIDYRFMVKMEQVVYRSIKFESEQMTMKHIPLLEKLKNFGFINYGQI